MLSPSATRALVEAARRSARLTGRETEVAGAVARGLSNSEVAAELSLSVATVKAHVARLLDELGVVNRVRIAICVHDARAD